MSINPDKSKLWFSKIILLRWLLKGLILAFCLGLAFILVGRLLRRIAVAQICELTEAKFEAQSIDFNFNGSVTIENIILRPDRKRRYDDTILKAQRLYARFGIGSLLLLRPRLKEIVVNDFVLDAQYDLETEQWNIAAFKIRDPQAGLGTIPLIKLEGGTLQYSKVSNGQAKVIAAMPIDAGLGPAGKTPNCYKFSITTARMWPGFGKSILRGFWRPGNITIAGGISSADIPVLERAWAINVLAADLRYDRHNNYSIKLKIEDFISKHKSDSDTSVQGGPLFPWERAKPFNALQKFFNRYRPWGRIDMELKGWGNLNHLCESALICHVDCKDVSICDRKFPYAVENIRGRIDLTEKDVSFKNLFGRHGDVELVFAGRSVDFYQNRQYQIRITSNNILLDKDLYNALSEKQKRLWSFFSPRGHAAINYHISRQPETGKKRTLTVELLGVEAECRSFPYPLKNLTGTMLFDYNSITVSNLVSEPNEYKITLNGKVTSVDTDRPKYDISIKANNIPLDSTLAEALPDRQKHLYNQFCLDGLLDADINLFSSGKDSAAVDFIADVDFKKASLKSKRFPLVISDILAESVITPDFINIRDLSGQYSQGSVYLTGRISMKKPTEQPGYRLSLKAKQIQLNNDLFTLLPGPLKKAVSELEPKGKINLSADLSKADSNVLPDYEITVDCLGNSVNFESFPYPLKNVTGRFTIKKSSDAIVVESEQITATGPDGIRIAPNISSIKTIGQAILADNTLSIGDFKFSANDICFDKRLGLALPKDIEPFYLKLSPTGRFDLNLENIKISKADGNEKCIEFDSTVKFKDCSFSTTPAINKLNAVLKTEALYKTGTGLCDGSLTLIADSLKITDKSLTNLKADVDYNRQKKNWLSKNLIADCYDGSLAGKLELKQSTDKTVKYLLQLGFYDIDLKQFLSDANANEKNAQNTRTTGWMNGSLSIAGRLGDNSSAIGRCRLKIMDMQVGKLSPLAKLLYVLKLTEPQDFAFDQMVVDSYIKQNKLFFEKFDLSGKGLAFSGSGRMDLESRNIDLVLTARGRRVATAEPSIFQSLTDNLGLAVVRMEVTGDLYDPQITTRTLPVFREMLKIIGTKPAKQD